MEINVKTNTNKKKETSKILLFSVLVLTYLLTIFICITIIIFNDLSPLSYLIPSFFGLSIIVVGFYSWKAKKENQLKLEIEKIKEEYKLKAKYKDDNIKINMETEGDEGGLG